MVLKLRKQLNNLSKYDDGKVPMGSYNPNQYLDFGAGVTRLDPQVAIQQATPYNKIAPITNGSYNISLLKPIHVDTTSTYVDNSDNLGGKISAVGQGAGAIIGNFLSTNNGIKSEDELLLQAGTTLNIANGVGWTRLNTAVGEGEISKFNAKAGLNTLSSTASGAAAGAKVGGLPGAIVGGAVGLVSGAFSWIGGGHKLRKAINNAKLTAVARNRGARAEAMTTGLIDDYYSNYGNTLGGLLYV